MDELEYGLLVLEAGCTFLERSFNEEHPMITHEQVVEHRRELMEWGFWDWFGLAMGMMEVSLFKEWDATGKLFGATVAYKRHTLIERAMRMHGDQRFYASFDLWLNNAFEAQQRRIKKSKTKQHVHH